MTKEDFKAQFVEHLGKIAEAQKASFEAQHNLNECWQKLVSWLTQVLVSGDVHD